MRLTIREAHRDEVPAIVALLADDILGARREGAPEATYLAAYDAMQSEGSNQLYAGFLDGRLVATYQLTIITGLSLRAAKRALVESVRIASDLRGQRLGGELIEDAATRARAAGCTLMQLTTNKSRADSQRFYIAHGFEQTHLGFKRTL